MGARAILNSRITNETQEERIARSKLARATKKAQRTDVAQQIVNNAVAQRGGELPDIQVSRLAKTLRFTKDEIRDMVLVAKENLAVAAQDYVRIHQDAVRAALDNGDARSLQVAVQGSQWAMENIGVEGARVIDRTSGGADGGTKILIGVHLGGRNKLVEDEGAIEAKVLPPFEPDDPTQSGA